jgi:hypothetical protein
MNTRNLLIIATIALGSFTSCKKDKENAIDEIETTFELSENQAVADDLTEDANDVLEETAARQGLLGNLAGCGNPVIMNWIGNCATVTVTGNFPAKNIRIDFGNGCTSPTGVVRKGIINIVITDSVRKPGSIATTTFSNYFVNGFKKEGTITRTNTSVQGSGTRSFNRVVNDGRVTSPAGRVWTHSSNLNITQTAGILTICDLTDDVFSITGTRTVTNANNKTRTSTTQTPLQKKMSCNNIDSGILQVQGTNHTAIVNFGNGTCDNFATISIDGRPERTIRLR